MGEAGGPTPSHPEPKSISESPKLSLTRRSFLIGAGAGAAAAGAVLGGAVVATKALNPTPTTTTTTATQLGPTMRRVTLDIDGVKRDVIVDNRESLWETMNFQLGLSNSNLGCDRAQCGACAVLVDGKAVNGCTVLSARLGRGQQIATVAGLAKGPGVAGLHPVQRAFWLDGGFQCGTPFTTIEDFDTFVEPLKKRDGILGISGSERTITIKWDPAKLDETKVRDLLASLGRPLR